ncbi:hypothetical protein PFISCL1PPCAC_25730, partial [Pristionchus fissidentatus]
FYTERRLLVSLQVEKVPETLRRGDGVYLIRQGGTIYAKKCLATIPRSAVDCHHNSQHAVCGDVDLESLIVRCPLWSNGCSFHTAKMRPIGGGHI